MVSASLMHETGHPKSVLWDNTEEQGGEGGGRRVQDGGYICIPMAKTITILESNYPPIKRNNSF